MTTWLPGAQRVPATHDGGSYDTSFPWRIVLHSTEGGSVAGAEAAYRASSSWPHLTVDCARHQIVQHYPLEVAARALMHPSGTPQTNGARAIQIEIIGFAESTIPTMSPAELDWFGVSVLKPLLAWTGAPAGTVQDWPGYPASYGLHAGQRMTDDEWRSFSGVCGHMHVPHNDHGDPGAMWVAVALDAAVSTTPHPPAPEFEMRNVLYVKRATEPQVYLGAIGFEPAPVSTFAAVEFTIALAKDVAIVAGPTDANSKDVQDGAGQIRKVWWLDDAGAELFRLP